MRSENFDQFWLYYLREHARPQTRTLHILGTGLALLLLGKAAAALAAGPDRSRAAGSYVLAAAVAGYAPAWIGHYFFEGNRPATFEHPLWSLLADLRMSSMYLTGRLDKQLALAGIDPD